MMQPGRLDADIRIRKGQRFNIFGNPAISIQKIMDFLAAFLPNPGNKHLNVAGLCAPGQFVL